MNVQHVTRDPSREEARDLVERVCRVADLLPRGLRVSDHETHAADRGLRLVGRST
jgi:hypothetical protein